VSELGPKNPRFLLADNELLTLFSGLMLVAYTEHANLGLLDKGVR
jgi:hypothetical protein